ncbi:lysophospholipid acyltransferase family protein [Natronospira proteinivora]|nr:lysophospholipid acyltransferase family protein [Natronospira proteinivora]
MFDGLRFVLFHIGVALMTPFFALLVLALWFMPYGLREDVARLWCCCVLFWLWLTLGIRHRVIGLENLPKTPAVILSNHQSAWETVAFRTIFPQRLSWVIKRSLFRIPFYGWALRALEEIGIDRKANRRALKMVEKQGKAHLAQGRSLVLFPEGVRNPVGELGRFAGGGARLACAADAPVVPVAVDSGRFWPVKGWRKQAGTITVRIGPPVDSRGRHSEEVNQLARNWIAQAIDGVP